MTRGDRHLVLLAVAAALLVAAVLWQGRREYLRDPPALTRLRGQGVHRIELEIPPLPVQRFERRADGWHRIGPKPARADDARLRRLARLAMTPVARWLPAGAVVPAKVGLAHPSATLVLDGVKLEYGGLTAIDGLRYVEVGDRVALVPRQYSPEVILTKPPSTK